MARVIKGLIFLGALAGLALIVFAYFGNLDPLVRDVSKPVTLNAD